MVLYSISVEENSYKTIDNLYKNLLSNLPSSTQVDTIKSNSTVFINIAVNDGLTVRDCVKLRDVVVEKLRDLLTVTILEDMQSEMVEKIINKEYFYFEKQEKNIILRNSLAIMWGGRSPELCSERIRNRWYSSIYDRIDENLNTNNLFSINGFITFRMKDFTSELENAVDRAVDDILIEKEYNEFIKLLRYFVDIQDSKVEEVHVCLDENEKYKLLDSSYEVIDNDMLEELAKEISDCEISCDDLLISSLITIAPNKITIHDCDKIKNTELLRTINNVFIGKVEMSHGGISPKL